MKTHRYLIGLAALVLSATAVTSCSEGNSISGAEPVDNSKISFTAVAPRNAASRAAATTTATLQDFVVYAYTNNKLLMDHVKVTRDGSAWTYSPQAYWPDSPVNFYAYSPDITTSDDILGNGTAHLDSYDNPGNVDLLYAVNMGEIQKGTPVLINFRHALSKVDVYLSTKNTTMDVKISKVTMGNVYNIASFQFPQATTAASTPDVTGKWTTYFKYGNITMYDGGSAPATLTADPTDLGETNAGGSFDFFIPQTLNPLSYDDANKAFTGSYIAVDCQIFDKATGAKLFPGPNTPAYLKVPGTEDGRILYPTTGNVIKEWKLGYSYTYNIEINNPAALLEGISFDVTVDEYNDGGQMVYPNL